MEVPSMLTMMCNAVEIQRLRHSLLNAIEQASILEEIFIRQSQLMSQEPKFRFPEQMSVEHFVSNGPENFINFIDVGPATDIPIKLAINEFDQALRSSINFGDSECFKALVLPLGLEELRVVTAYEIMHLQALIVGVQTNQIQLDNSMRKLSEIEFFARGFVVANPVFPILQKLEG